MAAEGTALRKRQQIAKANRTMFLWIAGVSVLVGVAVVVSIFLFQKAMFNGKVLSEMSKTADTLVENNKVAPDLQEQINVLNTNDDLKNNMVNMVEGEEQPVQVVLDALPATANSSGFGASLQRRFLQTDGIRLESLDVEPVQSVESSTVGGEEVAAPTTDDAEASGEQIRFSFSVSADRGNPDVLRALLRKLENSIRPIHLTAVTFEMQGNRSMLRVQGSTFYQSALNVDLKDKVIKP